MRRLFLILLLNSFLVNTWGQHETPFYHIKPETETGYRTIKNTVQDKLGYIWMSQDKGVLKYDGYQYWFQSINTIFNKVGYNDVIESVKLDANGNLLVLSRKGLLSRRLANGTFEQLNNNHSSKSSNRTFLINRIFIKGNDVWMTDFSGTIYLENNITSKVDSITSIPNSELNKNEIVDFEITQNKDLLFTTNTGILYKYSKSKFHKIKGPFEEHPGIMYLTLDKNDNLWIGTEYMGLFKYNLKNNEIIQQSYFRNKVDILKNDMILSLFCDNNGAVWAGSDGEGLYKIEPNENKIEHFIHKQFDNFSLSSNSIIDINEDNNDNIWIISNYGDINILINSANDIFHHNGMIGNTSARVLSVLKDSNKNLWIGTDGKGLTQKNLFTGIEKQFLTKKNSLEGFYIQTIAEDEKGNIWVGSYKNGLWFYDSATDRISNIALNNYKGKKSQDVLTIFKDSKNRIWIGSDIALFVYNSNREKIASFDFGARGLSGELIRCIAEDSNKNLWFGVDGGGLFRLSETENLNESSFSDFKYTEKRKDYYSIISMSTDSKGGLWIVDLEGELNYFNTNNYAHKQIITDDYLDKISFNSVLIENDSSIWLGGDNGLCKFNAQDSTFVKYTKADGLFSEYYIQRSAYKDEMGYLYFGGLNGVDGINPKTISKTTIESQLYINNIEILNKSALSVIPKQIEKGIENTESLELEYNQSSFSFRFTSIGTILNTNYSYAYRLKGFDNEWKYTKKERVAVYTNIPSGKYLFEVKSTTKNGIWNIPSKTININIKPPIWRHPIAYVLYLIIIGIFLYIIYRVSLLRKKLFLQRITNEEEAKTYNEKLLFFSKISHEIQTPLTLIMGPIESIISSHKNENNLILEQRLKVIFNNAKRLSKIANTLTTIRNKEIGQLNLTVSKKDIIKDIQGISESFLEHAEFKKIDFEIINFAQTYEIWFDKDLVDHIIYNLLSNAFKYTPLEGKITVSTSIDENSQKLAIQIKDSGYGISKREYDDIFKLFYRSGKTKNQNGMGIGLAFVKELVDLHKGEINVSSVVDEGTEFTVLLPLDESIYTKDEKRDVLREEIIQSESLTSHSIESIIEEDNNKKYSILIIEDNYEMLQFLNDVFSKHYKVHCAYDGKEGLKLAKKEMPDIIISDISMPVMNGLEMIEIIQKDKTIFHIPVVFLTAKNSSTLKFNGLSHGAVEFINKPFDINALQLKIHNILNQNNKLISKATLQYISAPKASTEQSKDAAFIEKLISILNTKLDDSEYKLESLSGPMNMSYSNIYRKCQKLTGQSIVDLIRLLRLKKAAILIIKNNYNISEACYSVGFNNTRYFSKCFKNQFKLTPTAFKKEAENYELDDFFLKYNLTESN